MSPVAALLLNVVRASLRNRTALVFTIGLAVFFMVVFGVLFAPGTPTLRVGVVAGDPGPLARAYVAALRGSPGLVVESGSLDAERDRLAHDDIVALVLVPPGFQRAATGGSAQVVVEAPTGPDQASAVALDLVDSVTAGFVRDHHLGSPPPLSVVRRHMSTTGQTSIDLLVPQMVAYLALQSGVNYVAITLVDQRQRKVLRRFLATPLRPAQILAGNILGGGATVLLQIAVLVLLGTLAFRAHLHGNPAVALLLVLVGTACFVSIGFLLCSLARTSEAARGLAAMVAFPMLFLSGVFIPLQLMPQALQNAVHALPLTYLSEGLRAVLNEGNGLSRTVVIDLAVLAAWTVACFSLAVARFRWE